MPHHKRKNLAFTIYHSLFFFVLFVLYPAVAQAADNRAVIIGINDYYYLGKIEYCVADSKAVRDRLLLGKEFAPGRVVLMTDDAPERQNQPTYANIERRLQTLSELSGEIDTLLVFFSGHGVIGEDGKGYLVPIDGSLRKGLELSKVRSWLGQCKAKNTLLILDCCHAGKGVKGVSGLAPSLAVGAGITVMASCDVKQSSYTAPKSGHSIFSLYLAAGLSGKADADKDNTVTANELFTYVQEKVSDWAFKQNKLQTPVRLPESGKLIIPLARVPKQAQTTSDLVPKAHSLPPLTQGVPLEQLVAQAIKAETRVSEARKIYTPESTQVKNAEQALKTLVLNNLAPRLAQLQDRHKTLAVSMRLIHPDMVKLSGQIDIAKHSLATAIVVGGKDLSAADLRSAGITEPWLLTCPANAKNLNDLQHVASKFVTLPTDWTSETRCVTVATPEGEQEIYVTYYKNSLGMEFVFVPTGEFMMGSGQSAETVARFGHGVAKSHADEHPQHRVRITKPFYMSATEVTQEQYGAIMLRLKKSLFSRKEKMVQENPSSFKGANNAVERVSWNDAVEFCKKLSQRDGVTYRLPTEAEWEYACRAGTTTPFSTGRTISKGQANYEASTLYEDWYRPKPTSYRQETTSVRSFAANSFGLYDMHGNVWEWCQDWYDKDYYENSPLSDPSGPQSGSRRVYRGGCLRTRPLRCRSANRHGNPFAIDRANNLGIRIVMVE